MFLLEKRKKKSTCLGCNWTTRLHIAVGVKVNNKSCIIFQKKVILLCKHKIMTCDKDTFDFSSALCYKHLKGCTRNKIICDLDHLFRVTNTEVLRSRECTHEILKTYVHCTNQCWVLVATFVIHWILLFVYCTRKNELLTRSRDNNSFSSFAANPGPPKSRFQRYPT